MRSPLLTAFFLLPFVALSAQSRMGSTRHSSHAVPDKGLMQEIIDAWGTLDPSNAAKYYDKSPQNVFFDDAGGVKFVGWQDYEGTIRKVMESLQSVKWTVNDDAAVHRFGALAWATATVHADMAYKNGTHQSMDERWTLIWAKKGANWLVVHEHFSAAPDRTQTANSAVFSCPNCQTFRAAIKKAPHARSLSDNQNLTRTVSDRNYS